MKIFSLIIYKIIFYFLKKSPYHFFFNIFIYKVYCRNNIYVLIANLGIDRGIGSNRGLSLNKKFKKVKVGNADCVTKNSDSAHREKAKKWSFAYGTTIIRAVVIFWIY